MSRAQLYKSSEIFLAKLSVHPYGLGHEGTPSRLAEDFPSSDTHKLGAANVSIGSICIALRPKAEKKILEKVDFQLLAFQVCH